jgi:undecaprenyl-diphosphatase
VLGVVMGLPASAEARRFAALVIVGCVPALAVGAVASGYVKRVLYYSPAVIAVAFIAGGIVMLLVERLRQTPTVRDIDAMPFSTAAAVGGCQVLALVPGVSRSGATIIGGLAMGLERTTAAEFSFFLSMPTMTAAFLHDFLEARHSLTSARGAEIGVGFLMAFLAALVVVKPFVRFIGRAGFASFAWYRIAAGAVLLVAIAAGWL